MAITINPETDILIINDLQNSFLPRGELENAGAGEIVPGILSLLSRFYSRNIHIFYHRHELTQFKDPKTRHSIFYNSIIMAEALENEQIVSKEISGEGISFGGELEKMIQLVQRRQFEKRFSRSYFKRKCPLLGDNFSLIKIIQENNLDEEFLKNGQRIFFCGLNLDPCVKNEIYHLLLTGQFQDIFIFEDLVRSYNPGNHFLTMRKLSESGVKLIKITDILKAP